MLYYPDIDPIIFTLGPFEVRWYGLSYLLGFVGAYFIALWRIKKLPFITFTKDDVGDLLFYIAIGVIVGGRLGFILLYQPDVLFSEPWLALAFWLPGRSFHGGLLGVLLVLFYYGRKHHCSFLQVTDFVAPSVPIALGFGRLGNFFNQELWGRVTDVPWGMVFPLAGAMPRHPSQLYECLGEGVLLSILLLIFAKKERLPGAVSGLFLLSYGIFRYGVEYFREPDHYGLISLNWLTMGQLLSIPMIVLGLFFVCRKRV